MPTSVETWFGSAFERLHPLLQTLHRKGGVLSGPVQVSFGRGLAGFIGRHLARRLGVPSGNGANILRVSISSDGNTLHWNRQFNDRDEFRSLFVPVGRFPSGHWVECSGRIQLRLRVSLVEGSWHWQHLGSSLWGLPLPRWLMPRTTAYKEVRHGMYHFHVEVAVPLVGTVLSYSGDLEPGSPSNGRP